MYHQIQKSVRRLLKNPYAVFVAAMLLPVFAAIHFAAYWLRFEGLLTEKRWYQLGCTMLAVLVIKTSIFAYHRIFQSWSRFATFYDAVRLAQAATVSAVALALYDYLFLASLHTPRAVFFMDWIGTLVLIGGIRCARRWMSEGRQWINTSQGAPALIIGADDDGEGILRSIRRNPQLNYNVVGFLAVHRESVGRFIGGVAVVGTVDQTAYMANRFEARDILIASRGLTGKQIRNIVDDTRNQGISVKVLPGYDQMLNGQLELRPRTVSIGDLLRRDPVQLDSRNLQRWLKGKTILVTGAAGSIGSEICRQPAAVSAEKPSHC